MIYASQILDHALKSYTKCPNEQSPDKDENIPTISVFWNLGTDTMTFRKRSMSGLLYSRLSMKSSM
jgi:hypothetical protein